jgi:hypothetical protein
MILRKQNFLVVSTLTWVCKKPTWCFAASILFMDRRRITRIKDPVRGVEEGPTPVMPVAKGVTQH